MSNPLTTNYRIHAQEGSVSDSRRQIYAVFSRSEMGFGVCLKWARKLETDAGSVRNDFWAVLRGWLKGYTVCGVVGWATGEREGDRDCLKSSLRAVLMEDGISYTKGGLSEEFAGSCVCVDAVAEWHVWLGEVVSWWLRISQLAKRERVRKRGEDDHDAPICLPHANPCSSFINLRCAQQCKVTFHWCKCARIPQHKSAVHICTHSIGKSQIRLGLKLSVLDFSLEKNAEGIIHILLVFRSCLPRYSLKKRL